MWALTLAFALMVGVRPGGGLFSPDVRYRLQTDAIFRGTFALQPVPQGQRADWAWGNGSQQVWGIGVPLLRMPGELIARVLGRPGFPYRLTLVALFALVMFVSIRSIAGTALRDALVRALVAATIGLMPAFVALSRTRLFVYEEAVIYGYLWAALQLVLIVGVARGAPRSWWFAAGGGRNRRADSTDIVSRWGRDDRRDGGPGPVAPREQVDDRGRGRDICRRCRRDAVDQHPSLRLSTGVWSARQRVAVDFDQFAKNFDYPYAHEPLSSASRELASALLGMGIRFNGLDFYGNGPAMHAWFSSTIRFREFYAASGATWIVVAIAAGGWTWLAARAVRDRVRALDEPANIVLLWSLLTFTAMAIFYLRMPTMTSRYSVDFSAALAAGAIGA